LILKAISIVCCTRDRPAELGRLIDSLIQARARLNAVDIELLVVDDGDLPNRLVQSLAGRVGAAGIHWRYHNKRRRPGLLGSRIEAVTLATYDWLLFFDDDVEIEPDYLSHFVEVVGQNPNLAGLGGVDLLAPALTSWRLIGRLAVGLEPLRLGRRSASGFPAHMDRARAAGRAFASLRVYGCNMAFRKTALQGLCLLPGFEGYSLYEDAYLSFEASRSGPLLVDPRLKVRHHHSPSSRDASREVGRMSVLNHCRLMRLYGASPLRHAGMFISILCLVAWSTATGLCHGAARKDRGLDFARGQLSGLASLFADLFRGDVSLRG
jgi:glycosyl transferase family 2